MSKSVRTDKAAIDVMREQERPHVWAGDPDLIGDIAERAGHKSTHPSNRAACVMSCIGKSALFVLIGRIEHLGHRYPLYRPKDA